MLVPKTMTATIRTPRHVHSFEGVPMVLIPGIDGDMGVLPQHGAMIIGLRAGMVTIGREQFDISPGVANIDANHITLYVHHFERRSAL